MTREDIEHVKIAWNGVNEVQFLIKTLVIELEAALAQRDQLEQRVKELEALTAPSATPQSSEDIVPATPHPAR